MSEQTLDESCSEPGCGVDLIRVSADDEMNPHGQPVVVCPGCAHIDRFV